MSFQRCRFDMKTITLTRGMSAVVDDDVFEWASLLTWYAASGRGGKWYAARTITRPTGGTTTEYMHRRIMDARRGQEVDHRDGDSLNDQSENLRLVTHQQNQQNVKGGYGAVGLRGVTRTPNGRYKAQAKVRGKGLTFGTFDTPEQAAEAARVGRLAVMSHSDGR